MVHEHVEGYQTLMRVEVIMEQGGREVSGTLFQDEQPRLVSIRGIRMEARLGAHMLYVRNQDRPGLIGALGTSLSDAQINIATFHLGRERAGGEAIALVEIDQPAPAAVLDQIAALPQVLQVRQLTF